MSDRRRNVIIEAVEPSMPDQEDGDEEMITTEGQLRFFLGQLRDMRGQDAHDVLSDQGAALAELKSSRARPEGQELSRGIVRYLFVCMAALSPMILKATLVRDTEQYVREAVTRQNGTHQPFDRHAPCVYGVYGAPFPKD